MRLKSSRQYFRGITLVEIILVVAILLIMAVSYEAVGSNFLARNRFQNTTNETLSFIRTAQINAMAGKGDSEWGVKIDANQIILFKGSSYLGRDPTFDEIFNIGQGVSVTNVEIIFDKITGNPDTTETISILSPSGETATISVNEIGIANVN